MRKIDKRSLTSRQNAKKCGGPKTVPGKPASCLNAITHAAYADTLILPSENLQDYQRLVRNHFQMWKPQNPIEESFVSQMATTLWRLQRMAPAQSNMIRVQIARMAEAIHAEFATTNAVGLYALAVDEIKGNPPKPRIRKACPPKALAKVDEKRKNGKTKLFSQQLPFNLAHTSSTPTHPDSLLHLTAVTGAST